MSSNPPSTLSAGNSSFALQDLEEMMDVGSGGKLTILAQVDRAVGESDLPVGGLSDFTSTKRLRVDAGELVELEDIGETNMGQILVQAAHIEPGILMDPDAFILSIG